LASSGNEGNKGMGYFHVAVSKEWPRLTPADHAH
jgi:hypothetical protein